MSYFKPTDSELREFYLCGVRMGISSRREAEKAVLFNDAVKAYKCEYCPGYHHVPANESDEQMLANAQMRFDAHIAEINARPVTESHLVLSNN